MSDESTPRRRKEDFDPFEQRPERRAGGRRPPKGRSRDFFERLPLIGLGLASAATPFIMQAGEKSEAPQPRPLTLATSAEPVATGDVEENIAERIGQERQNRDRTEAVDYAVGRYGIGHELAGAIFDNAVVNDIDPMIAFGLVKTESSFKHRATSHVGARGLTQVMPRTARWLEAGTKAEQLYDQNTNLRLGFKYLRQLIDKYDGDTKLALLAYNRGPGTVDKVLKRGGDPDNGYARKVMDG